MLCVSIVAPGAAVVMLTLDGQRTINKTLFYTKNKSRMKLLLCVIVCMFVSIGKVAVKKEDLQKYHGKDTWFQLQPVSADSEVQVSTKAHTFTQTHTRKIEMLASSSSCFPINTKKTHLVKKKKSYQSFLHTHRLHNFSATKLPLRIQTDAMTSSHFSRLYLQIEMWFSPLKGVQEPHY